MRELKRRAYLSPMGNPKGKRGQISMQVVIEAAIKNESQKGESNA